VEHGTLFFIPVGHSHVFRPKTLRKDRPLIVYNCLFPVEYLTELSNRFPQASEICQLFQDQRLGWFAMKDGAGEYHALFREMYQEFTARPPGYLIVLTSHLLRILTGLYRYRMQLDMPPANRPQWLTIDEAIDYIGQHYAEELRLEDMAAHANLSERQFSRLFKRQTGMSFLDYVQSIRIDAACRLLADGHHRVRDVASSVGYQDMKYFYQLFKRKTGLTPTEYRARIRTPAPNI
jgi:AraC-like DNA-binding protein